MELAQTREEEINGDTLDYDTTQVTQPLSYDPWQMSDKAQIPTHGDLNEI